MRAVAVGISRPGLATQPGGIRLARESLHPHTMVQAPVLAAFLRQHQRDASAALQLAESAITLATEQGFSQWLARAMGPRGWALAVQAQGETGIASIHQGLTAELGTGAKGFQPYFQGLLAEAYGAGDDPEAGLKVLGESLAAMDDTEVQFYEAESYRLKGVLLLKLAVPDATQAEACFQKALDIARNQQAKSWELRAAMSLARLWQSQDKRHQAYDLLTLVYGWFTEGFDTADLIDAKVLLDDLSEGS